MNRIQKLGLFGFLSIISFAFVAAIAYEIAMPRIARGAAGSSAVTTGGWLQLIGSILAATGFSLAGVWQAVAAFIESRLPTGILASPSALPAPVNKTSPIVVDVSKLTAFLVLMRQMNDDATKVKLTEAARMACDSLRDDLFPFPEPKS